MATYQRVTVELKQEHIDNGVQKSPCSCPIALALKEHFKAVSVSVLGAENSIINRDSIESFLLSDNALEFIPQFDSGFFGQSPMFFSVFFPLDKNDQV